MIWPRALLLDAMGTLLRLVEPAPALRALLAERHGVQVTEPEAAAAFAAEISFYRANLQLGRDAASLAALRGGCASALRAALPERARSIPVAELTATMLDAIAFEPYPDAAPALERARSAGSRTVVVSNWDCSLPEALARAGLAPLLDGVVVSAVAGASKPDPRPFSEALKLAGASAQEALHVGDSPAEDLAGARSAGIGAVLIARGRSPAPDTIADLREIPAAWLRITSAR